MSVSMPVGMVLEGGSSLLQPHMTQKDGVILPPSWVLCPLPPAPVPVQQVHWEPFPPSGNAPLPQGKPLVVSHFPVTPVVAGHSGYGRTGPGPFNIPARTRRGRRPAGSLLTQKPVLSWAPLVRGAHGVRHGGIHPPALLPLSAAPVITILPAPTGVSIQAHDGMWAKGLQPPAIPPVAPTMSGVNTGPPPHCNSAGVLGTSQASGSAGHTSKSPSVYENFRCWQHLKTLLQRHLPHTPDMEVVSCFLVPVLRSLSRRKPTMSVKQGLRIGVREWDHNSNYERMIFYEVAEKFMEFEVAEKLLHPKFQLIGGLPGCPTPAPPRPEPPRPPMPEVVQRPVCVPRQTDSKAQAACPPAPKCQQPPETKAPDEIPPEAVREYIDIMDWLEEHHLLSMPAPKENQEEEEQQEEKEIVPDLDLFSYCDELCSQEDFLTEVEAIINPQFLDAVESTDADMDIILATRQVLEEEHELTLDQLVERRLRGSKEKGGVCRPQSRGAPQSAAHQGAQRDDPDRKRRRNKETCSPPKASRVLKRRRATDEERPGPEVPAVLRRRHSRAPLGAAGPCALPQDLTPRGALALRAASATGGPASCPDQDDGDFSSLSFLLASPRQLLPWQWLQTPGPDVGLLCPGGAAPQASLPQRGGLISDLPSSARCKKRAFSGGSAPVGKLFCPGPSCEVSAGQDLAQGQVPCPLPKKGRSNKGGSQRRRRRKT